MTFQITADARASTRRCINSASRSSSAYSSASSAICNSTTCARRSHRLSMLQTAFVIIRYVTAATPESQRSARRSRPLSNRSTYIEKELTKGGNKHENLWKQIHQRDSHKQ